MPPPARPRTGALFENGNELQRIRSDAGQIEAIVVGVGGPSLPFQKLEKKTRQYRDLSS